MRHICKRILVFSMMVACIASIVLSSFAVVPVSAKGKNKKASTEKKIEKAKNAALSALISRQSEARESLYVYKDFDMSENHYTQKAKMSPVFDEYLVMDMDENWQEKPYSGSSCIRCEQITKAETWGGWLFLNGYLPAGESVPRINDGSSDGQGLDLTGAEALKFWARGEKGGEVVEFFTCGFGYEGEWGTQIVDYPDSTKKQSLGKVELTKQWEEYIIPLSGEDLSYIVCGFGYMLDYFMDGESDTVFYLDEIRFTGNIKSVKEAPMLLRSYDTENIYIKNAAFSYDNAIVAMAFMSEGRKEEAKQIVDAFVYAINNDRSLFSDNSVTSEVMKRVRNAYAAGDISASPGWESGAKVPGWYDREQNVTLEDRVQVGSSVGNCSFTALALMNYYALYGNKKYLNAAKTIMDWVLTCTDSGVGFTAGFDGWTEGNPPVVYQFSFKSFEHNLDALAAFEMLYKLTNGKYKKYYKAAQSAKRFIESMYDKDNGLFMTGTTDDGVTPNRDVVVLDAQVWSALVLGDDYEPYKEALKTAEKMKVKNGGYSFCLENKNGGWWAEGTAFTALTYKILGDDEKYLEAMKALASIQLDNGLFPAATVDNLSTGFYLFTGDPWEYSTDPHIVPAAWMILAANGWNPYVLEH